MRKKHIITAAAGGVGAFILAVSCIVTYATSSGYTAAKNSFKNLFTQDNCTMSAEVYLSYDDMKLDSEKAVQKFDKNGNIKFQEYNVDNDGLLRGSSFIQDGMRIRPEDINGDGIINKLDGVYVNCMDSEEELIENHAWLLNMQSDESQKYVRFAELFADTMVGDLKNNVILTDSDDECDTYSISLDPYQIPELYQAGLDLITEQNKQNSGNYYIDEDTRIEDLSEDEYYERLYNKEISVDDILYNEASVQNVNASVKIDKNGRLKNITGEIVINANDRFDKNHTVAFGLNIDVSDYGTTVIDRFNASELGVPVERFRFDCDGNERRIADLEKEISRAEKDSDKDENDENIIKDMQKEYDELQKAVEMPEYQRNKELVNALIFDELSDEDRKAYIEERSFVLQQLDKKDANISRLYYGFDELPETEAAEVIG